MAIEITDPMAIEITDHIWTATRAAILLNGA